MENILQIKNLSVSFHTKQGEVEAVRDVSLALRKGETLAIVGESGCGKSVLCKSVLKLLPPNAVIKQGKIIADNRDITRYSESQMQSLRGSLFSMVFQDPMMSLNPTIPVGRQITEALLRHQQISQQEADRRALELLELVGLEEPVRRFFLQPHFFSGGMRQRCVLAIALASNPQILFADEPTTALDVTMQAQILTLLQLLQKQMALSIVFVSHDLGVVARIADRVAIMYAGKVVEIGTAEEIFYDPRHPYTWGLLQAQPCFTPRGGRLHSISGMPPSLLNPPPGDAFAERNEYAMEIDYEKMPPFFKISDTHSAATWLLDSRAPQVMPPKLLEIRGKQIV
ncbi:ABC transporter ATP-binding protein [Sporomusa acidovorans]|uniref:Oligopeptide transport ATP-binding protein OppD n=1 Tax=Sporomusa acidovorans (strain ATCC 49682 / DSM 3132 / Mol) TaxID=1123286 RepID=A0ABZ3IZ06_SPOA4|nr:ABC transporter ATP-binding protein [Sporomusa acidovorans]OZC16965.1 oligopeptide transport ATP-binding protein OppD [Sporomusa acidovorans DSM 3132]SDE13869.1 oligopeptide transport system ATP-binding protein [Sporomusa acidovorans]